MKKVTAIVLALLMVLSLAACGSAASESKTLVMATSADYPPYEFIVLNDKNEQQYVGIDVSVSEAIAADMGKELQIVNMDFDSLMAGLQKGDADIVLAAIEVTEERLEAADFSDPYYTDLPPMILRQERRRADRHDQGRSRHQRYARRESRGSHERERPCQPARVRQGGRHCC